MTKHTVPEGVAQTPIGTYLKRAYPALPGWALRNALKARDVRVNGEKCGQDATVRAEDEIALYADARFLGGTVRVIYRDDEMLVVDKPAGLPVDRDGDGVGEDTLLSRIQREYPAAQLCHRLDAGTGGVLVASLADAAHERILAEFAMRRVEKEYRCVVLGIPTPGEGWLHGSLVKDADAARVRIQKSAGPDALPVETIYRVIETSGDMSLVAAQPITGRTHQIRAHMASIGHPLLGDDKYGEREANRRYGARQIELWCVRLKLLGRVFQSEPHLSHWPFKEK